MFSIGDFEKMVQSMEEGIIDYTRNGVCSNCGQCCSEYLPISDQEVRIIKAYIDTHHVRECRHMPPTAEPTFDFICPFRNDIKHVCNIYPVRPGICREFLCNKPASQIAAEKDKYLKKYKVRNLRKLFFSSI